MKSSSRQSGVALLTVLLVVTLATIASLALVRTNEMTVQRTRNATGSLQAAEYAKGLEAWARIFLQRDLEESSYDSRAELWAVPLPALEVTGGVITGRLVDLDGRFNLNALHLDHQVHRQRFQRLLDILEIDADVAIALEDWLDSNAVPRPNGAEDFAYLAQDPPYRAGNGLMQHASELRLVAGMSAEAYEALAPYVVALPPDTEINVNTAPIPVLMALHPDISRASAERLHDRGVAEFRSLTEFMDATGLANQGFEGIGLGTRSRYFLAQADIVIGESRKRFYSVLRRQDYADFATLERAVGRY